MKPSCPVKIRAAIPADVPAILATEQQAPTAAHWSREQYTRRLESGLVLVAEEQGKITGFICANPVAGDWEIENVVVAPEFQRQGIADRLMRELIDRAIAQGKSGSVPQILLEVRESSLPARALYQKHGFQEVGRRRAYYQDPLDDAILYSFRFGTDTKHAR